MHRGVQVFLMNFEVFEYVVKHILDAGRDRDENKWQHNFYQDC